MLPSTTIPKYPHGSSMVTITGNNNDNVISVASFNLLAPLYIRPIDQRTGKVQPFASFDWISEEDTDRILGNEHRLPRLLHSLQSCGCDFICVQELQLEREEESKVDGQQLARGKRSRKEDCECDTSSISSTSPKFVLPKWITPLIQSSSKSSDESFGRYDIILPPQAELEKIAERNRRVLLADVAITNAIFYKSAKWTSIESIHSATTCLSQKFNKQGNDDYASIDDPIVITSIHLDACSEEKRVQQLQKCLQESIACTTTPYIPPCIIAGDFNCELYDGSCINAFLTNGEFDLNSVTDQSILQLKEDDTYSENRAKECAASLRLSPGSVPTKEQLRNWDELHNSVTEFISDQFIALKRIDTGCTRVAYDHDLPDDGKRTMGQWHLDHIVYTPTTLVPLGRWTTLEDDEYSSKVGLPNDKIPTDHLPISALFERRLHPKLSEESKAKLSESLTEIENRHKLELQTKNEESKRIQAELEQQHSVKNEGEVSPQPSVKSSNKKNKKKKVPPPPEVIQHIRTSRQEVKELRAKQKIERQNFIGERTILERMVLQHTPFGNKITCTQWIESGR